VEETRELGQKIGELLNQPLNIALIGDLGGGKTVFVQGLAKGLDVPANYCITSPTFTLINEYPGRLPLIHADLYRLERVDDLADIGLEELWYDQTVLAVEWADRMADRMTDDYLSINFETINGQSRRIRMIAYGHDAIILLKALEMGLQNNSSI
jgi:tRNA threonylcarbamoyladenosine biosynthesis protein TsaE